MDPIFLLVGLQHLVHRSVRNKRSGRSSLGFPIDNAVVGPVKGCPSTLLLELWVVIKGGTADCPLPTIPGATMLLHPYAFAHAISLSHLLPRSNFQILPHVKPSPISQAEAASEYKHCLIQHSLLWLDYEDGG